MITRKYLQTFARYNRWQNGAIFAAADSLSDEDRRQDRGAFWHSVHGTLSHLYWADQIWLSRFDLTEPPGVPNTQSATFVNDWAELRRKRLALDDLIVDWCDHFPAGDIAGTLKWFSGAAGRNVEAPLAVVLPHFFNHQTHHRGQAHALVTAAGATTADTDLFLMPRELWPAGDAAG